MQFLWHVTDAQFGALVEFTLLGFEQAEQQSDQGTFAGAIGADEGEDLARMQFKTDVFEYLLALELVAELVAFENDAVIVCHAGLLGRCIWADFTDLLRGVVRKCVLF